jgi:hypothetical protein
MHAITLEELRTLLATHTPPCLSLYMQARRGRADNDQQRFAGLVRQARDQLAAALGKDGAEEMVAPLTALTSTTGFFDGDQEGLAVFRARAHFAHYRLPVEEGELLVIAPSFHIRPLVEHLQSNQRYFLLALNQNRAALFKGSAEGLHPVEVPGMPADFAAAMGTEIQPRSTLGSHSGAKGGSNPIFHGQGQGEQAFEETVARFYRAIDAALWPLLRDEHAPLILAAPERSQPVYRAITRYRYLTERGVAGNFDRASAAELHQRAWPIVREHIVAREDEVLTRYGNSISSGRSSDELSTVARCAVQGRVRELLLERRVRMPGTLDPETGAVHTDGKKGAPAPAHDDVLDDIAEAVLLRGGEVYSFLRGRMPTQSPAAATLRW